MLPENVDKLEKKFVKICNSIELKRINYATINVTCPERRENLKKFSLSLTHFRCLQLVLVFWWTHVFSQFHMLKWAKRLTMMNTMSSGVFTCVSNGIVCVFVCAERNFLIHSFSDRLYCLNAHPQGALVSMFYSQFHKKFNKRKHHEYCVWFMSFVVNGPGLEDSNSLSSYSNFKHFELLNTTRHRPNRQSTCAKLIFPLS